MAELLEKLCNVELKDWLTILAIVLGPILAIQAQRWIDDHKATKKRRLNIFYTLMANRANPVHPERVRALNMIDIEFYGKVSKGKRSQSKDEQVVTDAWKSFNDHLNTDRETIGAQVWDDKTQDLSVDLLYSMSQSLGYAFDKVQLKRDCYKPIAHGKIEQQLQVIRNGLEQLFSEKQSLRVSIVDNNSQELPALSGVDSKNNN